MSGAIRRCALKPCLWANGRVDQLEDRYIGIVEAPSSNLGTSTLND